MGPGRFQWYRLSLWAPVLAQHVYLGDYSTAHAYGYSSAVQPPIAPNNRATNICIVRNRGPWRGRSPEATCCIAHIAAHHYQPIRQTRLAPVRGMWQGQVKLGSGRRMVFCMCIAIMKQARAQGRCFYHCKHQ